MPIEQVITIVRELANVADDKIERAYAMAERKLRRIIIREGTANGERSKPEYFLKLVFEAIGELTAMEVYGALYKAEKEQVA